MRSDVAMRLALVGAMLLAPFAAAAQSVDYGALEQVFGEPITTSATGKPQRVSDVPATMVILTQDDIRRSGADTIPDILRFVTGLDVRSYGVRDADVAVRGYNQPTTPRLLVMVNGRQVYLDDFGYAAWNALPVQLDEIRQIEVVKGPNSALYGFNAAGGVINIITTDPILDSTNALSARTGTQGLAEASVVGTAHVSDTAGVRVSAGGFSMRDFAAGAQPASSIVNRSSPRNGTFNVEGSWQALPNLRVTAEGGVVDTRGNLFAIAGADIGIRYRISAMRLGVAADTSIGLVAFDLYRNQNHTSYLGPNLTSDLVNTVYVAKVGDLVKLDAANTIRVGFEYRDNIGEGASFFGGTVGYRVYSADAMWDWQVTPAVSVTNAVRVDHLVLRLNGTPPPGVGLTAAQYDRTSFTEPSFNSGVVWKVTEQDTLRLTAARGLQVPSLVDYAFQLAQPPIGTIFAGNPALLPTAVWNAELGYDRGVPQIASTLRTSVFFQRNDNLLSPSIAVPGGRLPGLPYSSQSANIGSSNEVGVELGIKGQSAGGWRWNASYSFASITDDVAADVGATSANFRHGTPQHVVILGGGYSVGQWELDAQGRWQSSFQDYGTSAPGAFHSVTVGNYVTFNARVGYRLTEHLTLSGTAQQFNVSRLVATAGPPVERRFIVAATAHF